MGVITRKKKASVDSRGKKKKREKKTSELRRTKVALARGRVALEFLASPLSFGIETTSTRAFRSRDGDCLRRLEIEKRSVAAVGRDEFYFLFFFFYLPIASAGESLTLSTRRGPYHRLDFFLDGISKNFFLTFLSLLLLSLSQ